MPVVIPNSGDADASFRVPLDNTDYKFRIRWNDRDTSWYCYIGLVNRAPAVKFKLVVGYDLLDPFRYLDGVPDGRLFLFDLDRFYGKPDVDNFGLDKRFRLLYFSDGETLESIS